jgi:flavin reductase (DIM6/NTAB) family NADH-FMN oxidoreductase RutF
MPKMNIGTQTFLYPMPVVLVGTLVNDKVNFMTVGWVSRLNYQPPLIAIAINKAHHTPRGIQETGAFSINIPSTDMVEITDYCGLVSGKTTDKSGLFEVFYGELSVAPMIARCPLTMECKLVQTVDLSSNHLFLGEIVASYSEDRFLTDGKPDVKKMDPLVLTMPDNGYWAVGEYVAKAWSIGKERKQGKD